MRGNAPNIAFIVNRAKQIILAPQTEWVTIEGERTSVSRLYSSYVYVLAAIAPVCGFVGSLVFGYGIQGNIVRPAFAGAAIRLVFGYALSLLSVYLLGLIIDASAPYFGGKKNQINAFKVAVYSSTAVWLAGVFMILPMLSFLSLVGLYSYYLLYLGLPRLMGVPKDKILPYLITVVVLSSILFALASFLISSLRIH